MMKKLIYILLFFISFYNVAVAQKIEYLNYSIEELMDIKVDLDKSYYTIEDLLNIEVTTASRKAEKSFDTAAATYVITSTDIKRSGVTSIPEALRMAPGVQVARIDSDEWAVAIRGFNDRYSDKLLVLIDGRSAYVPLFSGVYWNSIDYLLYDIERIEVIRGSGGAVWGANAVNGVINIITKQATDTQGGYAAITHGNMKNL